MSSRTWPWIVWALALGAVVLGLAWQVAYANGRTECLITCMDLLCLCMGGLDPWVLPGSVGFGLVLIGIGAWGILSRRPSRTSLTRETGSAYRARHI